LWQGACVQSDCTRTPHCISPRNAGKIQLFATYARGILCPHRQQESRTRPGRSARPIRSPLGGLDRGHGTLPFTATTQKTVLSVTTVTKLHALCDICHCASPPAASRSNQDNGGRLLVFLVAPQAKGKPMEYLLTALATYGDSLILVSIVPIPARPGLARFSRPLAPSSPWLALSHGRFELAVSSWVLVPGIDVLVALSGLETSSSSRREQRRSLRCSVSVITGTKTLVNSTYITITGTKTPRNFRNRFRKSCLSEPPAPALSPPATPPPCAPRRRPGR